MIYECIAEGARIGTIAFAALIVLALWMLALYGLFTLLAKAAAPERPRNRGRGHADGF